MNFIFHWLDSLVLNVFCFPKCWNELPAQELNAFNKLLKEHLLNSLDENFVCISFYNRYISISAPIGAYF